MWDCRNPTSQGARPSKASAPLQPSFAPIWANDVWIEANALEGLALLTCEVWAIFRMSTLGSGRILKSATLGADLDRVSSDGF